MPSAPSFGSSLAPSLQALDQAILAEKLGYELDVTCPAAP